MQAAQASSKRLAGSKHLLRRCSLLHSTCGFKVLRDLCLLLSCVGCLHTYIAHHTRPPHLTVEPAVEGRVHPIKHEEQPVACRTLRRLERQLVAAGGIFLWYKRRGDCGGRVQWQRVGGDAATM